MGDFIIGFALGAMLAALGFSCLIDRLASSQGQVPPKASPSCPPKRNLPAVGDAVKVRRYSAAWQRAAVHGTNGPIEAEGIAAGFSLETDSGTHRFHLDEESVVILSAALLESLCIYRFRIKDQSQRSSGMPSVDGSVPQEGQSV